MKKIIVTIPAYNEEKTIGKVIRETQQVMRDNGYDYKILVVDDGSRDKTEEVARKEGAEVVRHQINMGLAEAFRTEIEECLKRKAEIIVHTDADGQYRAEDIPKLISKVEEGYDLVLGSRFKGKIEYMPWIKRIGNKMFSRVISKITHFPISDGQTGFRAFTRAFAERVKIRSTHTYTQEQIIRGVKEKFRITEVPVYFAKRKGNTKSRLMKGPFDYALHAGVNLLRVYRDYEPLKFFGILGAAFLGAGIALGLWLVGRFLAYGAVGRIPSVVLSMLLISVGIQIVLFGFLADKN